MNNTPERLRDDLSPLAEDLLEFLHDRADMDIPVPEVARYFGISEDTVLWACQELYAARDAVMVSVVPGWESWKRGIFALELGWNREVVDHPHNDGGRERHDTRTIAVMLGLSEDAVLADLRQWLPAYDVTDLYVRAEDDPDTPRGRFVDECTAEVSR